MFDICATEIVSASNRLDQHQPRWCPLDFNVIHTKNANDALNVENKLEGLVKVGVAVHEAYNQEQITHQATKRTPKRSNVFRAPHF